jgi:vesicle coat complex subunit
MANAVEKSCTMLVHSDRQSSASEIKEALEGSDTESKIVAMQKAVTMLLNGEQLPQLFITIVRYVLPSEDHTVQKLLLLYLVSCQSCVESFLHCSCVQCSDRAAAFHTAYCRKLSKKQMPKERCYQRW